jgi:hypothetical protein
MVYITKMFKFYPEIFTAFHCGFLVSRGRCPICQRFRPRSCESCPHLWPQPFPLSVPVVLPNLQEEVEQTLFSTQRNPGALNQVIVVAKLSFHHVQSKQSSAARHEETTLNTCEYLSIKLKHILHFVIYITIFYFLCYYTLVL